MCRCSSLISCLTKVIHENISIYISKSQDLHFNFLIDYISIFQEYFTRKKHFWQIYENTSISISNSRDLHFRLFYRQLTHFSLLFYEKATIFIVFIENVHIFQCWFTRTSFSKHLCQLNLPGCRFSDLKNPPPR